MEISNRRYIGSKSKLADWIFDKIQKNTSGSSFCDLFAGTGIISKNAIRFYDTLIINDILYSNEVIYNAFFFSQEYSMDKIDSIVYDFNSVEVGKINSNYFDKNFGGKYFGKSDAKKIGYIREKLEEYKKNKMINYKEYCILLTSVIYSADKIANTVGHYEAYIKKDIIDNKFVLNTINVLDTKNKHIEIYREDANELAKNIEADVVFLDPPYNSRQYSRFYHVIENLVKWEKPKLYGVALKPKEDNMSDYCRVNAPNVFDSLVGALKCNYIVVTYNNTYNSKSSSSKNKIKFEEILSSLNKRGKTIYFEKKHQFFNAGKTDFSNHKEILFITEVK